jgi:hypothetical protein
MEKDERFISPFLIVVASRVEQLLGNDGRVEMSTWEEG